jgi:hypothetical protein
VCDTSLLDIEKENNDKKFIRFMSRSLFQKIVKFMPKTKNQKMTLFFIILIAVGGFLAIIGAFGYNIYSGKVNAERHISVKEKIDESTNKIDSSINKASQKDRSDTSKTVCFTYFENINNKISLSVYEFGPYPVDATIVKTFSQLLNSVIYQHLKNKLKSQKTDDYEFFDYDLKPINDEFEFKSLTYPNIIFLKRKNNLADINLAKILSTRNETISNFIDILNKKLY